MAEEEAAAPPEGEEEPKSTAVVPTVGDVYNCPLDADTLSLGAAWHSASGRLLDLDLSACLFGCDGTLMDAVYFGCMSAKNGVVRHMGDDKTGLGDAKADDEVICVYPNLLSMEHGAIVFMVTCMMAEHDNADLGTPDTLSFRLYSGKKDEEPLLITDLDIKPFVTKGDFACIPVVLYRVKNSWSAQVFMKTTDVPIWGEMVPLMKEQLVGLPPMFDFKIDPHERVAVVRKYDDRPLNVMANVRHGARERHEERAVTKVRCDLGWVIEADYDGKVDMDFNCMMFDAVGEEVAAVNYRSKEAEGVTLNTDDREGTGHPELLQGTKSFPVNESININLEEVPEEVKSIVFVITNYSGVGFEPLEAITCRMVDVSTDDQRDLFVFNIDSDKGKDADYSAVVTCKLYREATDSAYWTWRRSKTTTLEQFMGGEQGLLKAVKFVQKDKKLAEGGAKFEWRMRAVGLLCHGKVITDCKDDLQNVAVYEGRRNNKGRRHDKRAKVTYPNLDSFFGEYRNGKRDGSGIYVFHQGGIYAGQYQKGLRHGQGLLYFPDDSYYEGNFETDKLSGMGVYVYADHSKYMGFFLDGKKHGKGTYTYPDGTVLEAEWAEGKLQGEGVFRSVGHQAEHTFKDDVCDGPSKFTINSAARSHKVKPVSMNDLVRPDVALTDEGVYIVAPECLEEEGPGLPKAPKWEGLTYRSEYTNPTIGAAVEFEAVRPTSTLLLGDARDSLTFDVDDGEEGLEKQMHKGDILVPTLQTDA